MTIDDATVFDGDLSKGTDYVRSNWLASAGIGNAEQSGDAVTVRVDNFFVTTP